MKKSLSEILFGLLIIAVGAGFLLDALGFIDFSSLIRAWWPLLIVGLGVVSLLSNPRMYGWPLMIIATGIILQLRELGLIAFNFWGVFWPIAIIVFGLSILFKQNRSKAQSVEDESVNLFAAFSGHNARVTANKFKGGKATAVFGGIELDLTDAELAKDASLEVFTAFGGIDIRVPYGWRVEVSGLPLFGGWDNKAKMPKDKNAPVLRIQGTCLFGGLSIKN